MKLKELIKNLKRVYSYGKEFKSCLIIQVIMCIIGIAINIAFPIISAKFIVEFTSSSWKQAILMSIVILIISIFNEFKTIIVRKNTQKFRRGTVRNMQIDLGKETLRLEQKALDSNSSGVFVQRLINDTDQMAGVFTTGMGKLTGFISDIGAFIAVLVINGYVFLYFLLASIILTILHYLKVEAVGKKEKEFRNQSDKVAGLTGELVRGARDIKMLFAKESFMKELDSNVTIQSQKNFDVRNTQMAYIFIINVLKSIFEFLTIILLIFLATKNVISVAIAVTLYSYRSNVLQNLMGSVSELLDECKTFNISCSRVFEIINNKKYKKEEFGTKHIKNIVGNFEFKDVCFSYDGNKNVLDNFNIKIDENKTYGIVGKSGEGKTTMFNLLCKLYDIQKGTIKLDGIDISKLDEASIRGNMTIISQNPYIFNLSIKDNLKLVKSDITDEEIEEACRLACLDEFIKSLPDGLDTVVGEGGVTLSGGQRQRLAIARALVQKTKIILFDEATSALDNETQNQIQQAINNLKDDYTIVIIAHRLSTIMNCDTIFFMKDGKIIDKGTHKELLKSCKSYKELYDYEIKSNK